MGRPRVWSPAGQPVSSGSSVLSELIGTAEFGPGEGQGDNTKEVRGRKLSRLYLRCQWPRDFRVGSFRKLTIRCGYAVVTPKLDLRSTSESKWDGLAIFIFHSGLGEGCTWPAGSLELILLHLSEIASTFRSVKL